MRLRRQAGQHRAAIAALGTLALLRIVLSVAVLAASGSALLPGFPEYRYVARTGDAHGYYAAVRELLSTPLRLGWALPLVVAAMVVLVLVVARPRTIGRGRHVDALVAVCCVAAIATLFVVRMRASGAPTIGWPLVWSLPMFPYAGVGLPLDPDVAFVFGLVLSLLANTVTLVATYLLGLWTTGRRLVGLIAATLFALWPVLVLLLGKTRDPGTWQVDLGLLMYSEPVSTALVASACVLLVRAARNPTAAVIAGSLLGLATAVRLSNAVIAVCATALVARYDRRAAAYVALAGLAFLPPVIAYWPMGYASFPEDELRGAAFSLDNVVPAWRDSAVWGLEALAVLVPPAVVGWFALARRHAWLLAAWILATALFYTFYSYTPGHPRFFLVVLPAVFVLWSAGVAAIGLRLRQPKRRLHTPSVDLRT